MPQPPENSDPDAAPFNPLPPIVVALVAIVGGLELLFTLADRGMLGDAQAVGWRLTAIRDYAFLDQVFDWMLANRTYPTQHLVRFVTYPLIHVSFTHALFVVIFILAMGKIVGEVFGSLPFLIVFFASSIVGAAAFGLLVTAEFPLVGGYPGVYGLIGAFTFLMWVRLNGLGENQFRAFSLIGVLLGIQLVFGLLFGSSPDWVADLAGFATGFALSPVLIPGGWGYIVERLRKR